MVEVMDRVTLKKLMAMILCGIRSQESSYLIYCVRRNKEDVNIFVSKLIKGSLGYVIDSNFLNGEKEVLDNIVKRLLNKEIMESLEKNGFSIIDKVELDSSLSFDIDKCYVSTVNRGLIKECLIFYDLVNESMFNQPIVKVVDDKRIFNEGFASSIVLIIFGGIVLLFSIFVVYNIMVGR